MSDLTVANTILAQLGGGRFTVMTGAKNYLGSANSLSFRLPGSGGFCKDGINAVRIVLEASDTYTVTFSRVHGSKVTEVATVDGVYEDTLRTVFTEHTGLATSL